MSWRTNRKTGNKFMGEVTADSLIAKEVERLNARPFKTLDEVRAMRRKVDTRERARQDKIEQIQKRIEALQKQQEDLRSSARERRSSAGISGHLSTAEEIGAVGLKTEYHVGEFPTVAYLMPNGKVVRRFAEDASGYPSIPIEEDE